MLLLPGGDVGTVYIIYDLLLPIVIYEKYQVEGHIKQKQHHKLIIINTSSVVLAWISTKLPNSEVDMIFIIYCIQYSIIEQSFMKICM